MIPPPLDVTATDAEVVEWYTRMLESPDYVRLAVPGQAICARYGLTPQTLSNWVARSARTGVSKYRGGYDPNEILRWLLIRGGRATRSDKRAS